MRRHIRLIVLILMFLANGTIAAYVTHYMTTYAQNTLHVAPSIGFATGVVCNGLQIISILLGGWLADRAGRKWLMIIPQLIVLAMIYPTFLWIVDAPGARSLLFGFGALSFFVTMPFAAAAATITEALPRQIRGGAIAIVYAFATATFGGTAQLVVTWLLHVSGNPLAPAWYLLLATTVGLIALILMPETAPAKDGT